MTKTPTTSKQRICRGITYPKGVIHRILRLIPTIPAARMSFLSKQWEGLRSSGCVLDFVEDNLDGKLDDRLGNFINTCDRYIDQFLECDKISIDKFTLILNRIEHKLCAGDDTPIKRMSLFFLWNRVGKRISQLERVQHL
ncbi:hypothetical protein C1H46_036648 [Malus baccata]|uniref:F-box domain-containing protein n=1 Tax=Malus baccata TaxID=106549 RepID=A0A540KUD1_MALBA|nr:hypothetical protein C1H46_036648 [Malus baccata]